MPATTSAQTEILALEGEVDLHRAPEVREKLAVLIGRQVPRLLIDLSKVTYIDSSGLALFIEAMQRVQGYGGSFALFGLGESVRTILHVACLDQVFTIFADEVAAGTGN